MSEDKPGKKKKRRPEGDGTTTTLTDGAADGTREVMGTLEGDRAAITEKLRKAYRSVVLGTEEISLPCDLAADEIEAKGSEAADVQRVIELLEEQKAETSKRINADLKECVGRLRRLLYEVRTRKEDREIRCEQRLELPYVCTYRTDTGELVSRRTADGPDRQQGLPSIAR